MQTSQFKHSLSDLTATKSEAKMLIKEKIAKGNALVDELPSLDFSDFESKYSKWIECVEFVLRCVYKDGDSIVRDFMHINIQQISNKQSYDQNACKKIINKQLEFLKNILK